MVESVHEQVARFRTKRRESSRRARGSWAICCGGRWKSKTSVFMGRNSNGLEQRITRICTKGKLRFRSSWRYWERPFAERKATLEAAMAFDEIEIKNAGVSAQIAPARGA